MHRANIEKIAPPSNATLPSIAPPRDPEKQSLNIAKANSQPSNMPRLQHLCFTLLILALLGLTIVSAASSQQGDANGISDAVAKERLRFQELLNSVEPSSLHEVLHTHMKDRYKHGVYQEDKHAMEVVHQENAVVARSLLELAKRQSGNSTVIVTTTASTFTQVTTTATQTSPPVSSDTSLPPKTSQTSQPAAASTTSSPHVQQTSSPVVHSTSSPPVASTNGTLLGGPAAYPFAPPAPPLFSLELQSTPVPPSAYIPVQNSSISATAAASFSAPSPSAYQFVQSSTSSTMAMPSNLNRSSVVSTPSIVLTSSAGPVEYVLNSSSVVSTSSIVPTPSAAAASTTMASNSSCSPSSTMMPTPSILNSSFSRPEFACTIPTSCILKGSSIVSPTTPPYPLPSNNSSSSLSPSGNVLNCSSGVLPVSSVSSASPSTSSPSSPSPSPSPSPSGSQVQTTTYDQTTAAASRSVTQQILYTSTFPNGGVTTVTSLTVVPAEQAQTAGGTSTNTANASLQTNSAKSVKAFSINGVLAALGLILVFGA